MQQAPTRRCVLATLSSAAAMSLIGGANGLAQEAPPETSTIRLIRNAGICIAPQYVADELLRAEGFTDIQHLMRSPAFMSQAIGRGEVDLSLHFAASILRGSHTHVFSSRLSSLKKRQSVPCAMILFGADLIMPASCNRSE